MENSLQDKLNQILLRKNMISQYKRTLDAIGKLDYNFESSTSNIENKEYIYENISRKIGLENNEASGERGLADKALSNIESTKESFITKEQILDIIFSIKPDYINQITNMIAKDEFEDGVISESERFVKKIIEEEGIESAKGYLMNIYYDNIRNPHILCGIMNIISNISYSEMVPQGPIMALGLLQNESFEVRDNAIKAFENWNSKDGISCLESLKCDKKWMQDYVEEVIANLRESGE